MTDEQLIEQVKRMFPNYELGELLPLKEYKKHEHELFDLLINELESRIKESLSYDAQRDEEE